MSVPNCTAACIALTLRHVLPLPTLQVTNMGVMTGQRAVQAVQVATSFVAGQAVSTYTVTLPAVSAALLVLPLVVGG